MKYSTEGLAQAGMELVTPFQIGLRLDPDQDLDDQHEELLTLRDVARILPGRRISGLADFQNQRVFAKVFYGKGARRYWQRELHGAELMRKAGTRTPGVLFRGTTSDDAGFVVLYEALPEPQALNEHDMDHILAATEQVVQLHEHNLLQTDIHLNNFVMSEGTLYLVDADGVRASVRLRHQFYQSGHLPRPAGALAGRRHSCRVGPLCTTSG